jgi:hypothetical protein
MTPKEKAKELMLKYYYLIPMNTVSFATQCALIAVDEILDSHYKLLSGVNTYIYKYWQEVKQEINKL